MNETVKITLPPPPAPEYPKYPYWGINDSGDLFLVVDACRGIAVQHWTSIGGIDPTLLRPLPVGTKIELTIK